jgi:uncharacterized membrane protein YciS (DUF1049 family)
MLSVILRTLGFLLILFVVVTIGMDNTHRIEFRYPLLLSKPAQTSAALIYFSVFAVGVIGGTLLHAKGGSGSSGGDSRPKKK